MVDGPFGGLCFDMSFSIFVKDNFQRWERVPAGGVEHMPLSRLNRTGPRYSAKISRWEFKGLNKQLVEIRRCIGSSDAIPQMFLQYFADGL